MVANIVYAYFKEPKNKKNICYLSVAEGDIQKPPLFRKIELENTTAFAFKDSPFGDKPLRKTLDSPLTWRHSRSPLHHIVPQ